MDKEILRIVIIATGLVVIVGMVLWSFAKGRKSKRKIHFYDGKKSLNNIDPSLALHPENDEFDIVALGSPLDDNDEIDEITVKHYRHPAKANSEKMPDDSIQPNHGAAPSSPQPQMPALIQFSLVAVEDEGFNGVELVDAFSHVGLEYGSLKIFERVDKNRLVDFGVASMVEPGTFPDADLDDFYCPGLVFFMQPREVDDPVAVFDDFVQTIDLLALELGGVKWDHQQQPLTEQTIETIRNSLQ
ncbi:MAG: cell division protein ZipA C-terminal FtsZ-binding domain-containing protein [Gammaproteobacteria bacterium]